MKISVVIPSYSYEYPSSLELLLESLAINSLEQFQIIVSHDFTPGLDRREVELMLFPGLVKNVFLDERGGFSKTVNAGIKASDGDIILLMNSDLKPTAEFTKIIEDRFTKDPQLGIMGAKTTFPDGRIQHAGAWVNWIDTDHYGAGRPDSEVYNRPFYCPWVTFAYVAIRRKTWEDLGGLAERYFMYCEDSTFCFDAWEKGWKVLYEPALQAIHQEAGTVKKLTPEDREHLMITRMEGQKMFRDEGYKRDWNSIHRKVWQANQEFADPIDPKVLIIERHGALGDVVMLTSLLDSLRANHPDWHIGIRTNCHEIFRGNPVVYEARPNLAAAQARVITLNLSYESRPGMSIEGAFQEELKENGFTCEIGPLRLYSDELDWHAVLARYRDYLFNYAVIHAAKSHWRNRTLPSLFWAKVVHGLKEMGLTPVVVGTGQDQSPEMNGVVDLRGRTTYHELHQLIAHARVYVGSDSGPLHIARATKTPKVGIFTILNPATRMELDETNQAIVPPETSCRYCLMDMKVPVNYVECPKNKDYQCTETVSAEETLEAIRRVLGTTFLSAKSRILDAEVTK